MMGDHLLFLHLKEEWRMMTSYFSSEKLFFLFPLVLFFLGFLMALLIPFIEKAFDIRELLVAFHLLLGLYGLFVGGFGFFADEVAQTWFGEARLLIHMHTILPISFRKIFTWFYIKDIVYYLVLTLIPLFLGAFLSFTIPIVTFARIVISSTLSFLIGVSVSFLVSSLYVRKPVSAGLLPLIIGVLYVAGVSYEDFPPLSFLFRKDLFSLVLSVVLFIIFSVISLAITKPVTKTATRTFSKSQLFSRVDPLLAKEIVDVRRSGTWRILITSYLFPLFFLYGIFYFSEKMFNFSLDIPLVFYAVFIGYLSTLVYSWLNNIDPPLPMAVLPVTTSQLLKKKIKLFSMASLLVAVSYLVALAYILSGLDVLLLSVYCMGSVTFYVAAVTAYLCGLYPNTRLFDGSVLVKYLAAILPVLILLSILSLMRFYTEIVTVASVVLGFSFLLYKRLEAKYEGAYLS